MDSALARAARISLRGAVYRVRATAPGHASYWVWHFNIRAAHSGLGIGTYPKELGLSYIRTLRIHTQSALSRKLHTRPGLYRRRRPLAVSYPVRFVVSGHLFAGDAC